MSADIAQPVRRRYLLAGLDRNGVMLGLSLTQVGVLIVGMTVTLLSLSANTALPLASIPLIVAGAVVKARWRGVTLLDWVRPLSRLAKKRTSPDWETAAGWTGSGGEAPEVLAGVSVSSEQWSGLEQMGVVWDSAEGTAAVLLEVPGSDFALRSESEQESFLDGWGLALSAHAMEGAAVVRICWSEIANRSSLADHVSWVRSQGRDVDSERRADYERLVSQAGPQTTSHKVIVTVVVSGSKLRSSKWGSSGKTEREGLLDSLRRSTHTLLRGLANSGLGQVSVLDVGDVAKVMRQACDPTTSKAVAARVGSLAERLGGKSDRMGPLETWWSGEWFETDKCAHRSWWVEDWPRQPVHGSWLSDMLAVPESARRFTVVFMPVPAAASHSRVEKELTKLDADAMSREESGKRVTAGARRSRSAVEEREEELVSGFAEVAYCGIVTVSADSMTGLEQATGEFEGSAIQAGLGLRPLDYRHDLGWAASLPLGLGVARPLMGAN